MPELPVISAILTVPGSSTSETDLDEASVQVGIVIDGEQIAWGVCTLTPGDETTDHSANFRGSEVIDAINSCVAPALIGQKLSSFRRLSSIVESVKETVTVRKEISQPDEPAPGISRREIISGFLATQKPAGTNAMVEETTIERRLHPAIRHGLSQALLGAVAVYRRIIPAEVIAKEFGLPLPATSVPFQLPIIRGQLLHISDQVAALGYKVASADPRMALGPDGEKLQHFVRQLRQRILAAGQQHEIAIHLDLAGGLGLLYDGDIGRILGALYGLEQAASPGILRIQDPLIGGDLDTQIRELGQLRNFLGMRQMSLQLVAGAQIRTLDDVVALASSGAVHMLHLVMSRLGTIQETILAIQACRTNRIGVMLEGTLPAITGQVALTTLPDILVSPPNLPGEAGLAAILDDMTRSLTWLAHKK